MNAKALSCLVFGLAAIGCAGRTAPFNEMDTAAFTVYKLQGQEAPPPAPAPTPAPAPGGIQIPGLPPELQQLGQQAGTALQQILPPGVLPPGLIPGTQQPGTTPTPVVDQRPRFKGFVILAQMPLTDETIKEQILDVFGDEDSFQSSHNGCFFPGLGISMVRQGGPPVDLLVSLSCNQAQGDGFRWPYPANGFTPDAQMKMTQVYEKLWGPVPPAS